VISKEVLEKYCLDKKGVIKQYPFDKYVAVYKVGNKMFALSNDTESPLRVNVKCNPLYALELRSIYEAVNAGYHMNKKHWNTVTCDGSISTEEIFSWIDDSYALVFNALSKKEKALILQ